MTGSVGGQGERGIKGDPWFLAWVLGGWGWLSRGREGLSYWRGGWGQGVVEGRYRSLGDDDSCLWKSGQELEAGLAAVMAL